MFACCKIQGDVECPVSSHVVYSFPREYRSVDREVRVIFLAGHLHPCRPASSIRSRDCISGDLSQAVQCFSAMFKTRGSFGAVIERSRITPGESIIASRVAIFCRCIPPVRQHVFSVGPSGLLLGAPPEEYGKRNDSICSKCLPLDQEVRFLYARKRS